MNSPSLAPPPATPVRLLACCLLATVSGFILFVLPELFHVGHYSSFMTLYRAAVEHMAWGQGILLFVGGGIFRVYLKPPWPFVVSMCFVASLPILASVEMVKDPTSHNLWPIEFLIYALTGLIPYAGMITAPLVKKFFIGFILDNLD